MIKVMDMPYSIHELVRQNIDNTFTIFINAHDCAERQQLSIKHAINHIRNGDFNDMGINASMLEVDRH
jgi:uncharacterized protein YjaG (DUF416 family)